MAEFIFGVGAFTIFACLVILIVAVTIKTLAAMFRGY